MNNVIEEKFSKFLAIGLFITTVIVVAGPLSEPVNLPKMLTLSTFAFGCSSFIILNKSAFSNKDTIRIGILSATYLLMAILSSAASESPFSQNLYGIFGRNTGLLTNISFVIVFLVIAIFTRQQSLNYLLISLVAAGIANIIYGFVENFFGDPIPWVNNYGALLGLFGNPDFAGAFYGMLCAIFLAYAIQLKSNKYRSLISLFLFLSSAYCVILTKTTQGILVLLICVSVVGLLYIHYQFKNKFLTFASMLALFIAAIFVLLGIMQKGPLAALLYKRSVSLRGVYWDAAFEAGKSNWLTGVGLDSFGDWYRRARSEKAATWFPGPETITNVAHNYYLDIFAYGGIIFVVLYILFTLVGIISIFRIISNLKSFEYFPVALIALFVGFQAQAIISIPQIGLAIWGWVINGMLYSYARIQDVTNSSKEKNKAKKNSDVPVGILIFVGTIVGFVLAVPPYSADAKWTNAVNSQDLVKVESALQPSYFSPSNSDRLANAALLLQRSNLSEKAHEYALKGVQFNPNFFSAWKVLYYLPASTLDERKIALDNMKRLDPLNETLDNLK